MDLVIDQFDAGMSWLCMANLFRRTFGVTLDLTINQHGLHTTRAKGNNPGPIEGMANLFLANLSPPDLMRFRA